jgi:NAD(P)H-hydrate epimerase
MAQGGMGDVLTGIIGSLLAQGYSPLESTILGVFLHGSSGEWLAKNLGPQGFTASEVANLLPNIFQSLETSHDRPSEI